MSDEMIFDRPGPQITNADYGREPTLREIVTFYYQHHLISRSKAEKVIEQYIADWGKE